MNRKFDEIYNLKDIEKLKIDIDQKIAQLQKEREEADNYYTDFLYSHAVTFDELIEPLTDKELVRLDELCASNIKLPLEIRFNAKLSIINGFFYIESKYINGFNIRETLKDFETLNDIEELVYNYNNLINGIDKLIFHTYKFKNDKTKVNLSLYDEKYNDEFNKLSDWCDEVFTKKEYLNDISYFYEQDTHIMFHLLHRTDRYYFKYPTQLLGDCCGNYSNVNRNFNVIPIPLSEKFELGTDTYYNNTNGEFNGEYIFRCDSNGFKYHFNNNINKVVGISHNKMSPISGSHMHCINSIHDVLPTYIKYYDYGFQKYGEINFLDINEL